ERELPQRKTLNYPPYGHLLLIRLSSLDQELVEKTATNFAKYCQENLGSQAEILGPAPATIMRVAERYRWHLVLKFLPGKITYPDLDLLQSLCPRAVTFSIDIDPLYIE
ncbi:MAG: primosomal protein N', partial [Microcystaceae cyanobacterium]